LELHLAGRDPLQQAGPKRLVDGSTQPSSLRRPSPGMIYFDREDRFVAGFRMNGVSRSAPSEALHSSAFAIHFQWL